MSVAFFQRFFGVLALVALAGAVALVVARFLRARAAFAGATSDRFGAHRLEAAWLVATVATAGSLYFQWTGMVPCRLCWIQRGFMYPLVIVLGVAMYRGAPRVRRFVIPWVLVGFAVSTYHYLLEWFPKQLETNVCDVKVPCSDVQFRAFNFVSLPFMAGCGFLFIASVLALPLHDRSSSR